MESMCLRLQHCISAVTGPIRSSMIKVNGGYFKVNQISCSTMKILFSSKKLSYTHIWNLLQGSWSLQSRYQSSRGFAVRAEADAGFPVSYESSEADNKGEKMVVKSGLKLSDTASNVEEFVASQTGGPGTGDGDGHGGHGHEGNNGGGDSNNNNNNSDGYGDSEHNDDKLINTVWWLILQCLRMLRTSIMWGSYRPELLWLEVIGKLFKFVAADLMMSTGSTTSEMPPLGFALTAVIFMLLLGFVCLFAELGIPVGVTMSVMLAGFVVVTGGVLWAVFSLWSNWDIFQKMHNEIDDENDYSVE